MRLLAQVLLQHPLKALSLLLVLVLANAYLARHVWLDNNFAQLFSTDNQASRLRTEFRDTFGPDDNLLVAIIQVPQGQGERAVALVETITDRAAGLDSITRVDSISHTSVIWSDEETLYIQPAFGELSELEGDFERRKRIVLQSSLGGERLLNPQATLFVVTADMPVELDSFEEIKQPANAFRQLVQDTVAASGIDARTWFIGLAYTRVAVISDMQRDLLVLTPVTVVVLSLLLLVVYRRLLVVVAINLCMLAAFVMALGLIGVNDDNLNQLTIVLPILIVVIVVANAIHLIQRYRLLPPDASREQLLHASQHTLGACFLSCVTTACGFASLSFSQLFILQTFGVYLAWGVLMSFLGVALVLVPLVALKGPGIFRREHLAPRMPAWLLPLMRPRVATVVTLIGVAVVLLSGYQASQARFDYAISDMLDPQHPVARGNTLFDEQLLGIIPVEISLSGKPQQFKEPDILRRMQALAHWYRQTYGGEQPKSLAAALAELNAGFTGEQEVPSSRALVEQLLILAESAPDRAIQQLVNDDYSKARIRANVADIGARGIVAMRDNIDAKAAALFAGTGIDVHMTGEAPVAYEGMLELSLELMESLLIAVGLIIVLIAVFFRSLHIAAACLLPNILPIGLAMLAYLLTHDVIDPLPGIVFCVAVGICVDDTVHLVARYKEELLRYNDPRVAMQQAVTHVRGALTATTVVLAIGFAVLMQSSFEWNRTFGSLGAAIIVMALFCDLIFVPAMVTLFKIRNSD